MSEGLYVQCFFDEETTQDIALYLQANKVPNPVLEPSLHTTIVYSRVPVPGFEAAHSLDVEVDSSELKLEIWDTKSGRTLVAKYFCPYLHIRFQEAMALGATYDFDEYKPHVTLSYDVGEDFELTNMSPVTFNLRIVGEYEEALQLD